MKQRKKKSPAPANHGEKAAVVTAAPAKVISQDRLWLFRFATVLSPILLLLLLEGVLRVAGFGHPSSFFLPTTINGQRYWIQNDRFAERFLGREMARQPFPLAIPQSKPANSVRIFVFGESAAFGDPQPEFGLPRMLEALLSARFPGAQFEIVNTAMTAINSHAILPITRECPTQPGDIWVLYMGNNEVVGPYGAGTVFGLKAPRMAFIRCSLAVKATRIGQLLERVIAALDKRPASKKEWTGMQMFLKSQVRQDDLRMLRVYDNFQQNLADMLAAGRQQGAKIVVSTVGSSLKDCAPFASLHRANLAEFALSNWEKLYQNGVEAQQAGRAADAAGFYKQAAQIDDTFAEQHFRWGKCCLALGQADEALQHFSRARDLDTLRFRCDTRLNEIVRTTASRREADGVRLVDAETALQERTSEPSEVGRGVLTAPVQPAISGGSVKAPNDSSTNYFYEHVHLIFEGNYRLALLLAQQVATLLPEKVIAANSSRQSWPSLTDCARRLAWTDFSRREAASLMYNRLNDAPFTNQLNHAEQMERLRQQLEELTPAIQPAGLQAAAARCRDALALSTNDWILHNNLGRLEQRLGDYISAAKSLRRVVELMPHYVEGWEGLAAVLVAQNQNEEALAAFDHALHLEPDSIVAQTGKGQIFASEGKNEQAVSNFERALKIKSYWQPAHLGLAKVLEAMGRKDEAEAHFREALTDRLNTPASFKALGQLCFEKGRLPDAARNFSDALRLDPSDAATHVNLGMTLGLMGRQAEAREHYAEAVRLDPALAEAHARLGLELGRAGNDVGAVEQFAEAVRLKPDLLEARLNLGIALTKQRRTTEASEQFHEVLRRSPTNAVARKYLTSLEPQSVRPATFGTMITFLPQFSTSTWACARTVRNTVPRVLITALAALISLALTACGPATSSSVPPILLFNGTGTSPNDVAAFERILKDGHRDYSTVNSWQLNRMSEPQLMAYRLLIIPGGNFIVMGDSLKPATITNIHNAVQGGLNYLGICAGGFLAGHASYKSLNLTSGVRFNFYADENRGIRKAAVAIACVGTPTLDYYWEDGPQFTGWGAVVGKYPDETPAVVEGPSGKGWVILSGVHPEAPANWRHGMTFRTPASADNAYATTLIDAALHGISLPHY